MNCVTCEKSFRKMDNLMRHVSEAKSSFRCSRFSCISCSSTHFNISEVSHHIQTEEHSILSLATGIFFDAPDAKASFPPLDFCIICSCRKGNPYHMHLKSVTHKNTASTMRSIFRSRKIYFSVSQGFTHKMINVKRKKIIGGDTEMSHDSPEFVCELCNIYFNELKYLRQHLENQSHKRMEEFVIRISLIVKEMDVIGVCDANLPETFSNSLPPLYYCESCCLWVETKINYNNHLKGKTHKQRGMLASKSLNRRGSYAVNSFERVSFNSEYKLCRAGFSDTIYKQYRSKEHKRVKQYYQKDNTIGQHHYKRACKMLKTSTETDSLMCEKICRNKQIVCRMLSKEDATSRTGEAYGILPQLCLEAGKTKRDLQNQCGFEPGETKRDLQHQYGFEANQTNQNLPPQRDLKGISSATSSYAMSSKFLHQPSLEVRETAKDFPPPQFSLEAHKTNCRCSPESGFVTHKTNNSLDFETNNTDLLPSPDIEEGEINSDPPLSFESSEANDDSELQEHYCELCDFVTYNSLHYDKHLMSEQHAKIRRLLNKKGRKSSFETLLRSASSSNSHPLQYNCELCDVMSSDSEQYKFHLNTAKHKRNHWLLFVLIQRTL